MGVTLQFCGDLIAMDHCLMSFIYCLQYVMRVRLEKLHFANWFIFNIRIFCLVWNKHYTSVAIFHRASHSDWAEVGFDVFGFKKPFINQSSRYRKLFTIARKFHIYTSKDRVRMVRMTNVVDIINKMITATRLTPFHRAS